MSFWDRLLGKDGKGPLGGMWTAAQNTATALEAGEYLGALGSFGDQFYAATPMGMISSTTGRTPKLNDLSVPYKYAIARPITTYNYATQGLTWSRLADGEQWDKMTDADTWAQGWEESKLVSPGQSTLISGGVAPEGVTFGATDEAIAKRKAYFEDSWSGKLQSGSIDLILNFGADPLNLTGAGSAKYIQGVRQTIKPAERADVLAIAGGSIPKTPVSKAVERKAQSIGNFIRYTEPTQTGLSASEIALHPALRNNPEGGTIAWMLHEINTRIPGSKIEDVSARRDAKLELIGSMLGDSESIAKLNARSEDLANELKRISEPPPQTRWVEAYGWDNNGQGSFIAAQKGRTPEIEARRTQIMDEMVRLDRTIDAAGSSNRIGPNFAEAQGLGKDLRQLNDTGLRARLLQTGRGERAIVLLSGQLGKRLDGHVSLRDPVEGFNQLKETLKQAPYMQGLAQRDILDKWVGAATDTARAAVVREAEAAIVRSTAQHYNLSEEAARLMIEAGEGTRRNVVQHFQERMYSADKDSWFHTVDPESDRIVVRSKPLARSQVEDFHPVIDPRALDNLFRAGTHTRFLEELAAKVGGRPLASFALDKADPIMGLAQTGLMYATKIWKDATLLPRAPAYAVRIQFDSQARLATHMGTLAHVAGSMKDMTELLVKDRQIWRISKEPGYEAVIGPRLIKMGIEPDDVPDVIRNIRSTGGSMADLANEVANYHLQGFRRTGSWDKVKPDAPEWQKAYDQAVLQIKNSPTMMAVVNGADEAALVKFLKDTPEGRSEWATLRGSWGDDMDQFVGAVKNHVETYLPDSTSVGYALGKVSPEEIAAHYSTTGLNRRMEVHGESYAPTSQNKLAEWYNKGREYLYRLAADAPETTMARVPMYVHEYNKTLNTIMANLGDGVKLDPEAMLRARRQADRQARRAVGKVLFDASHTSNLASTFRFVSPFFSAWEDMMTKWSRLFYNNPGSAQRFVQAWNIPADAGILHDEYGNRIDADGNAIDSKTGRVLNPKTEAALIGERKMVMVPLGFVPKSIRDKVGVEAIGFDQGSFNVVFQGEPWWLPGFGPLVAIPANSFVRSAFPEAENNPIMKWALPFGATDESIPMQALPAWAKNLKKVGGNDDDFRRQAGILMKAENIRWQNGERPTKPTIEEISAKTRNWYWMRTMSSLLSPISTQPKTELQFYIDQGRIYRQLYGDIESSPEYKATLAQYEQQYSGKEYPDGYAKDRMLAEHPEFEGWESRFQKDFPEYFDAAISVSVNETGLVANIATVKKIKKYKTAIAAAPEYAWAIAGPDNAYGLDPEHEFSNSAYVYQTVTSVKPNSKDKFRTVEDADDALASAEAQRGWVTYSKTRAKINLAMHDLGVTSLQEKRAEPLAKLWKSYKEALIAENPAWAREFGQRDTAKAMDFMRTMNEQMQKNPDLAKEPQMEALSSYIRNRGLIIQALKQTGNGIDAQKNEAIKHLWGTYVQALMAESPGFEQIYNRILEQDDLSMEVPQ